MARLSLFGIFQLCLIGTTLFIIATFVMELGEVSRILVTTEQMHITTWLPGEQSPDREYISFNNLYWQTLTKDNASFYFFNAYYDNRRNSPVRPAIRVTAMMDVTKPPQLYCRIWVSSKRSVIVKVHTYHPIWFMHWKLGTKLRPFLITCPIPKTASKLVPRYLSFITRNETLEQATNLLQVMYNNPKKPKKKFAVCVKGLDFPEDKNGSSMHLVEWLETQWLLGVDKVIFYVLQIHPNFHTILEHYKSRGRVQMIPLTLPGNQPNEPKAQHEYLAKNKLAKRLNEVIAYNDCLYRNLYLYEYIAVLDTDELIIPVGAAATWSQMLKSIIPKAVCKNKGGHTSYMAQNVYFMDDFLHKKHGWFEDIPRYMYMLQHVYRTANYTKGRFPKGLHKTNNVLTLHNHFAHAILKNVCKYYFMLPEDALLYHYRNYCVGDMKKSECEAIRENVVLDTGMWRYKGILTVRTTRTLIALGLLSKNNTHAAVT